MPAEQSFEHDLSVGGRILSRLCICPSIPIFAGPIVGEGGFRLLSEVPKSSNTAVGVEKGRKKERKAFSYRLPDSNLSTQCTGLRAQAAAPSTRPLCLEARSHT